MYSVNIKNDIMDCRMCGEEIHPKRLEYEESKKNKKGKGFDKLTD